MTKDEIEAALTKNGGYTKAQLAKWGVPWPPPKGWKKALIRGSPLEQFCASRDVLELWSIMNKFEEELAEIRKTQQEGKK